MKQFYSLLLVISASFNFAQAQSLNPGQVSDNVYNKVLMQEEYALVNSNKQSSDNKDKSPINISGHKEINFTVAYNAEENNFSGSTEQDSMQEMSGLPIEVRAQSRFESQASSYDLGNINFMQLKLHLGNDKSSITITNLKLNGVDITGSYSSNTSGDIYWHLVYGEFGSNFTVTGTINIVSNDAAVDANNMVVVGFGSSSRLSPEALSVYWGEVLAGEKNRANTISWNTNKEENNDRFIIERSSDGLIFTGIGLVNGAGNRNSLTTYNYTDNDYALGINYYRIKQIDMEGHASYSLVVRIENTNTAIGPAKVKTSGSNGSSDAAISGNNIKITSAPGYMSKSNFINSIK